MSERSGPGAHRHEAPRAKREGSWRMRGTIELHHYGSVGHFWAEHRASVMGLVAAAMIATAAAWVALPIVRSVPSSLEPTRVDARWVYPAPELPIEWRWERGAVDFDHMYGEEAKLAEGLDWIGDPEHR